MKLRVLKFVFFAVAIPFSFFLQSCSSSDVGGNGDTTKPVVTLSGIVDANAVDDEIIGEATIQWTTNEPNRSTVDIYLSVNSGVSYPATPLANSIPDTGEYTFDTNTIDDCRTCRLKIVARDVVGNVSDPVESTQDFIINNVPQVLGVALYVDPNSNGADAGDTIVVPFDKDIEIRTGIASDIFYLPVLGDTIGPYATLGKGTHPNELVITMNGVVSFEGHLHINKEFNSARLGRTAPSGLNVYDNLSSGVLYARDTGRTAAFVAGGIDIIAGFADANYVVGADGAVMATGDLDNDGDLDVIQGSYGGLAADPNTGFRVRLNNGAGTIDEIINGTPAATDTNGLIDTPFFEFCYTTTTYCPYVYEIALVDVDGDTDLDLIQGSDGGYGAGVGTRVWLNQGGIQAGTLGQFADSGQALCAADLYGYCSYSYAFAFADVDGDGDQDMIEGTSGMGTRIWLNNGSGSFTADGLNQRLSACSYDDPGTVATCDYYYTSTSLVVGDVDDDGDQDVVTGNSGAANQLWLNNGSGVFTASTQLLSYCNDANPLLQPCSYYAETTSIALADADGDTDLDLFVAGSAYTAGHGYANRLWLNNGTGVYTDSGQSLGNFQINAIAVADTDGDDDIDLVQGAYEGTRVWRNNGAGAFSESGQLLGGSAYSLFVDDLDGDSDLDLIPVSYGARFLLNSLSVPAHYFVDSEQAIPESDTRVIALADVDGDGDLDKIEGGSGQGSRVFLNNVSGLAINQGVYTDSGQLLCSEDQYGYCSYVESIAVGDVDADGDLDFIDGNNGSGNRLWLNDGSGIFTESSQRLSGCSYDDPATTTIPCDYYYSANSIVLGDVDGDGDLDLVADNSNGGTQVWLNDGGDQNGTLGHFTDAGQRLSPCSWDDPGTPAPCDSYYSANAIVLGNIDGDTDLDLIVSSNGAQIQVWKNDGAGNFSTFGGVFGSSYAYAIVLGNVDVDAYPDLIVGSTGAGSQVWQNDGTGNFMASGAAFGSGYAYSIALGDVDGDDDLDLVVGNSYQANELRLNNGSGAFTNIGQSLCRSPDPVTPSYCNSSTQSVVLGDVDNDDDLDLVQGGYLANEVWLNDF